MSARVVHRDQVGSPQAGVRVDMTGRVQGIGFRPWVHALAHDAAIAGRVWNHPGGVTIEAFGEPASLRAFVDRLSRPPMPAARVGALRCRPIPPEPISDFAIVPSRLDAACVPSIPPDLATCDACLAEMADPADRRHRHAFIACTHCGPRYTIALDVPYDRARTTMAAFPPCADCAREYRATTDRRFHAEPIACPACGPRLRLEVAGGRLDVDPIAEAARLLREGRIVGVKGLGGYHLACDATDAAAVRRLRARKRRDDKPFAVMVTGLHAAERLAVLRPAERALLSGAERPVVLAERRADAVLAADAVAPGTPLVGLLLPYTPLHALLLEAVGRPLVMTSGNRSDEPIACDDDDARARLLGPVADALLAHDRVVANRCDDSVARVVAGQPLVLRRSRGWVPASLPLRHTVRRPGLACGGHLKNAFCLASGDVAWIGPHVGDLDTDEACAAFDEATTRFARFVGVEPVWAAHDLHPDYATTRWAEDHFPPDRRIAVQHHHAHAASAMLEHGLAGPVLALTWDGTGFGPDGTAWGGELLFADLVDFRRLGTFRPLRLAGGERAIREPWRMALALIMDAFGDAVGLDAAMGAAARLPLAPFRAIERHRLDAVHRLLAGPLPLPSARGVGRYFDAFGALALGLAESRHEGQVAMRLGFAADPDERRPYPFAVDPLEGTATADLRQATRAAVGDLADGVAAGTVAGRFHATLVAVAVEQVAAAERLVGRWPVVLTGGCFQNARLVEDLIVALGPGREVVTHGEVPPNDGGLAAGQAAVAAARLAGARTEVG